MTHQYFFLTNIDIVILFAPSDQEHSVIGVRNPALHLTVFVNDVDEKLFDVCVSVGELEDKHIEDALT
jgi:hypothetical protein